MADEIDFGNIMRSYGIGAQIMSKTIADLRPQEWTRQPNEATNHMLWVLGHMTASRGAVLRMLGQQWSAPWENLFGRGAKLEPGEQYPQPAELIAAWDDVSKRLADALSAATSATLEQPAPPGPPSFDGKLSGTLVFFTFHEGYHVGQAAMLHKWLGHGQVVG